jgi:hypothetical protein
MISFKKNIISKKKIQLRIGLNESQDKICSSKTNTTSGGKHQKVSNGLYAQGYIK